ncbi:DUF4367 domain-containing protein [Paenibacillus sp. MBLB4367]|uniref:outer membrane lipoprotein-sorting protein n=1 Tax=Paenibacillus sp. MBLB4367 TaxID=3384767 RepID=UPI003908273C
MRRITWIAAIVISLAVVLAGCGSKNAGSVVKQLDHVISKLDSYQSTGTMTLNTGQEPQVYQVEVWFQDPHYYRISLTNDKKDITQIVLRNDDGVFVLTPHLNKSFRFQSDWPENQGQVYLYQSLVQSIMMDSDRQFTAEDSNYVFDVLANYQNSSLSRQKIWLDKKNYAPKHVEVFDANANVMVVVDFNQFQFGKTFDKDSFDMQRNMTSWNVKSLPTTAQPGDGKAASPAPAPGDKATDSKASSTSAPSSGQTTDGKSPVDNKATDGKTNANNGAASPKPSPGKTTDSTGKTTDSTGKADPTTGKATDPTGKTDGATGGKTAGTTGASDKPASGTVKPGTPAESKEVSFGVIEPSYKPKGVTKQDMSEVKLGDNKGVMLRYTGTYHYTLQEFQPKEQEMLGPEGTWVDLGYTVGVMTGTDKKTLVWMYDGIQYRLSSGDLPHDEMVNVAQSLQDQIGK